jgi:hypothetical protein
LMTQLQGWSRRVQERPLPLYQQRRRRIPTLET